MPTADDVTVEFEAKIGKYEADLRRAARAFENSTGKQRSEMAKLEKDISRNSAQIGKSLRGLAATFAAAFSVQQIQQLADGYTRFTNQLKVAGLEGASLGKTQEQLFGIAQKYGAELESLGTLYSRGTQVSKELGASQSDLIRFTEGVAAALKVQGTSATEAQGALLQLSQLLASGTVRAEEFNSVNEGALPILQAVARNLDAAGGSVGKLKMLVNDGKVSSEQFFRAFIAGSEQLQAQAEKTTLTIGNSFTILNNALGKYIGETDQSLSATQRISAAIITLSENLDTVVRAITLLATVLAGRYAASLILAARNTGFVTTAIFAMQARAAGAATTMEALGFAATTAGRSMLAAFGGPIGIAVTALTVAFIALADQAHEAAAELAELEKKADDAADRADVLEQRLRDAGVGADKAGQAAKSAASDIDGLTSSMGRAITAAFDLASQLRQLEAVKIAGAIGENRRKRAALDAQGVKNTLTGSIGFASPEFARKNPTLDPKQVAQQQALDREYAGLTRQLNAMAAATEAGVDITDKNTAATATATEDTKKKTRKSKSGPSASEIEQRHIEAIGRIHQEELQAQLQLADSAQKRADIASDLLKSEYAERLAQIENDKNFTTSQKEAQKAALSALYGLQKDPSSPDGQNIVVTGSKQGLYFQQVQRELQRELDEQLRDELSAQADVADARAAIAGSLQERVKFEAEALAKQMEIERSALESAIDEGRVKDAAVARALLADRQAAQAEQLKRQLTDEYTRQLADQLDAQSETLDSQADLTFNNKERAKLERQSLLLQQEIQRLMLEQAIANGQILDADKARAELAKQQAAAREGQSRSQAGPLDQYRMDLTSITSNINDAIEGIAVDQLKSLTSNLADAIVNFRSLGDVGVAALRSLTAALIELAIQQLIIKTIGKSLGADVSATSAAEGAAVAAAWAPAAAAVALATLGQAALPAAAALAGTYALSAGLAAVGRKDGGPIVGAGGPREDKVLVAASPEEYMIQARSARMLGRSTLDYINATGRLPTRADGGPIMPTLPSGSPARAGDGGARYDAAFRADMRALIGEALKAMPDINLYPTLDPASVLRAALNTSGGRKALFDTVGANSGKFKSTLE